MSPRARAVLLGAARGSALSAGIVVLWMEVASPFGYSRMLLQAAAIVGAVAGGIRAGWVARSLFGTVVAWMSVALAAADVVAAAPHAFGAVADLIRLDPLQLYVPLLLTASIVGLAELAIEATLALPDIARSGAIVGWAEGLAVASLLFLIAIPPVLGAAGLGVLLVAWTLARRTLPAPDRVDPALRPPIWLLCLLVAATSLSWQIDAARRIPVARLRAGLASLRPLGPLPGPGGNAAFSPDGRAVWYHDGHCNWRGWRLAPGKPDWSPYDPEWTLKELSWDPRYHVERVRGTHHDEFEVRQASNGATVARLRVDAKAVEPCCLQGDLIVFEQRDWRCSILQWRTGQWWARDCLWPLLCTPDGRLMLLAEPTRLSCREVATGRIAWSRSENASRLYQYLGDNRHLLVRRESGDVLVLELETGREVSPASDVRSPDGPRVAHVEAWGLSLRDARTGNELARLYALPPFQCAVAPDGRCNGEIYGLCVVDGDRTLPMSADYPLIDASFYPKI